MPLLIQDARTRDSPTRRRRTTDGAQLSSGACGGPVGALWMGNPDGIPRTLTGGSLGGVFPGRYRLSFRRRRGKDSRPSQKRFTRRARRSGPRPATVAAARGGRGAPLSGSSTMHRRTAALHPQPQESFFGCGAHLSPSRAGGRTDLSAGPEKILKAWMERNDAPARKISTRRTSALPRCVLYALGPICSA